jgi:hypothetical protein
VSAAVAAAAATAVAASAGAGGQPPSRYGPNSAMSCSTYYWAQLRWWLAEQKRAVVRGTWYAAWCLHVVLVLIEQLASYSCTILRSSLVDLYNCRYELVRSQKPEVDTSAEGQPK